MEEPRSTQSDRITSGFLQNKLSLLGLFPVAISCSGAKGLLFMCLILYPEYAEAKVSIAYLSSRFGLFGGFDWQGRKMYRDFKNSIVFVESESIL